MPRRPSPPTRAIVPFSHRGCMPAVPSTAERDAVVRLGPVLTGPPPGDTEVAALCASSGLSRRQVRFWLAELPRRAQARQALALRPAFVELTRPSAAPATSPAVSPATVPPPPLCVVLPNGLRIELPRGFDAPSLRAAVEALSC